MLATPGELPPAERGAEWAYETKWDGVRAVMFIEAGQGRLMSRNDRDITVSYPELAELANAARQHELVLDGEIVAFGADGLPSFARLQRRMHVANPADAAGLAASDPVSYVVFDLLHVDGHSTLDFCYDDRRRLLETLELDGPNWHTPAQFTGSGADLLRASKEQGLEGIVAKRRDSRYRPGRRSPDWRKIKNFRTQEVVIGGWRPGNGRRSDTIGSLLLGIPEADGLHYVGSVGTGFTERMLSQLLTTLRARQRATSPFVDGIPRADLRGAHWAEADLVGEVAFGEWTPDGRLRHPAWRGLRPDKEPSQVRRES